MKAFGATISRCRPGSGLSGRTYGGGGSGGGSTPGTDVSVAATSSL